MHRKRRTIRQRIRRRDLKKNSQKFRKILVIGLGVGIIYLLFFSSFFKIKEITFPEEITSNIELTEQITTALNTEIGSNLITTDTEDLTTQIIEQFSELESIIIKKNYPDKLEIEFEIHPQAANIVNQSNTVKKTYIINSIGYVVKEDFENPALPYIYINTDEPVNPAEQVLNKEKLDYILSSAQQFSDQFGMDITQIVYKPIPREVHLITAKDFTIWLDIQQSYEVQFKKLKKALPKLDIHSLAIEYIDLRIAADNGDRIIYKLR